MVRCIVVLSLGETGSIATSPAASPRVAIAIASDVYCQVPHNQGRGSRVGLRASGVRMSTMSRCARASESQMRSRQVVKHGGQKWTSGVTHAQCYISRSRHGQFSNGTVPTCSYPNLG